jgi:carbon monoxide dehydrogenase subunit G
VATIALDESFSVTAPAAAVWDFLLDPRRVVACVPGGALGPVIGDRAFEGTVRVELGPLTLAYGGQVELALVDAAARRVRIVGRARERAGADAARLTLDSWLAGPPEGPTEVTARASVEVSGRIVALGLGVLAPLGHLVFQEFAGAVRDAIEAAGPRRAGETPTPPPATRLRAVPLVLRALRAWLAAVVTRRATGGRSP